MTSSAAALPHPATSPESIPFTETTCCVVGGGPAGAMLGVLLARRGVRVTLLEMHKDFDREFRGDTVHPSTLEILEQIGLVDRVLQLRHGKIFAPMIQAANAPFSPFDLRRLRTKYPYILMVHQKFLLEILTEEASKFPNFRLVMGANVTDLIAEGGVTRGVRYSSDDGVHEVRALLTVGADGRFSQVRRRAGFDPVGTSPPMDVLWFRLPRFPDDPLAAGGAFGGVGKSHMVVGLDRYDYWQAGYVILKGSYQDVRAEGIEALKGHMLEIVPQLAKHLESLTDWRQISLLSVESNLCPRWYAPGLLLIGDAAHVMSPIGGVGINYAIQDAVVAANLLTKPLLSGRVSLSDLEAVQKKREWPVRFIQFFQAQVQKRVIAAALQSQQLLRVPWYVRAFFRIPFLRNWPSRVVAYGPVRVRVNN